MLPTMVAWILELVKETDARQQDLNLLVLQRRQFKIHKVMEQRNRMRKMKVIKMHLKKQHKERARLYSRRKLKRL